MGWIQLGSLEKTSTFYSIEDFNLYYLHCSSSLYTTSCGLCDALYRKSQLESQTDYTNFLTQFLRMYFVLLLLFFHPVFLSSFTTVLYTLWRLLWSITVHMHGKMQSIWFIKTNSNVSVKDLGARKKKNKSGDVIWRHPCVCLLIDHDQQTMKMHTEVTL